MHLFAKNAKANLSAVELEMFLKLAKAYGQLSSRQLEELTASQGWRRIERD